MDIFQKEQDCSLHGGSVRCRAHFGSDRFREHNQIPQLPMQWWLFNSSIGPFMALNHGVDVVAHHAPSPGGFSGNGLRIPVSTGLFEQGGIWNGSVCAIWNPFIVMSDEIVARLDGLRHLEYGIHLSFRFTCAILHWERGQGTPSFPIHLEWNFHHLLSNDEWRRILEMCGWPKPCLFELHPHSFSDLREFEEARSKLRQAEQKLLRGDYPGCVALCRIIVESVFKQLGYKRQGGFQWESIVGAGLPSEMAELFRAFNKVANSEHHAGSGNLPWSMADARFLLRTASALAEYAGNMTPKQV